MCFEQTFNCLSDLNTKRPVFLPWGWSQQSRCFLYVSISTLANVEPFPSDWMVMVWVRLWRIWSMSSSQNLEPSSSSSIRAPYAPFFNRSSTSSFDSCCTYTHTKVRGHALPTQSWKTSRVCSLSPHSGFLCGWCPAGRLCLGRASDWPCQTSPSRTSSWWSACRPSPLCSDQSGGSVPEPGTGVDRHVE